MRPVVGQNVVYLDLSNEIMKMIFDVHNQRGARSSEEIYECAVIIGLKKQGLSFESQKVVQVVYKGELIGTYRLDLVVDSKILLELKAGLALKDSFKQQTLSYLKATRLKLGILINFGRARVEYLRIAN